MTHALALLDPRERGRDRQKINRLAVGRDECLRVMSDP